MSDKEAKVERYPYPSGLLTRCPSLVQFDFREWLSSEICTEMDPRAAHYATKLMFLSLDQEPIGTLPCDDEWLSGKLGIDGQLFRILHFGGDVGPLFRWRQVICDQGDVRWAHPVVTSMLALSLKECGVANVE